MESGVANTQDPNLNVGLPVFTIHGNHDDPSGPENLSAVDLLSAVHYVNYFGKHTMTREGTDDVGKIVLSPVLLMKVRRSCTAHLSPALDSSSTARALRHPQSSVPRWWGCAHPHRRYGVQPGPLLLPGSRRSAHTQPAPAVTETL